MTVPIAASQAEVLRAQTAWRRWWAFCFVGAMGIAVQLAVLDVLIKRAGLHYLLATALAVEAAVFHNFAWHEHWTWCDRAQQDRRGWRKRLARFQLSTGAFSICGNAACMWVLAGIWQVPYLASNLASIAVCSTLNFLASEWWVFQRQRGLLVDCSPEEHRGGDHKVGQSIVLLRLSVPNRASQARAGRQRTSERSPRPSGTRAWLRPSCPEPRQ